MKEKSILDRKYFIANFNRWNIYHISKKYDVEYIYFGDNKGNYITNGLVIHSVELTSGLANLYIDLKHKKILKTIKKMWKHKKEIKWELENLPITFDEMKMIQMIIKMCIKAEDDFLKEKEQDNEKSSNATD